MPLLLDLERVDTMVVANLRTEALGISRCLAGIHGFLAHGSKIGCCVLRESWAGMKAIGAPPGARGSKS